MILSNCKNCDSSNLRALYMSATGEEWVGCDDCGNTSTPIISNHREEIIAVWNKEQESKKRMKLVILESPYAGDVQYNISYARRCVRDSLLRGEAPIASHLLYTQDSILDDDILEERQLGIDAGLAWKIVAEATVVYADLGITKGMQYGIAQAKEHGLEVEIRYLFKKEN